jgi:hypothetical protein
MSEVQAERAFKKHKKKIIAVMGIRETTDLQLLDVAKKLFGKRFLGVYPQDTIPLGKTGMLIANTDVSSGKGTHWTALVLTAKTVYIFDSFARPAAKLMKVLTNNAKNKKIKIMNSDLKDKEQHSSSAICGQLCLAWLCVVKEMGVRAAMQI